MPEIGGKQLVRELQRVDPGLKDLAITGYSVEQAMGGEKKRAFWASFTSPLTRVSWRERFAAR